MRISQCGYHRPRLQSIRCRCPCHRATHWYSAAAFISSRRASNNPVGCDASVEDLVEIQGVEVAQRALALQPCGNGVPTYTPHPIFVEQFSSQVSTTYRPRAELFLFTPPIRDLSCYGPQARLNGEDKFGRSVTLYLRQPFGLTLPLSHFMVFILQSLLDPSSDAIGVLRSFKFRPQTTAPRVVVVKRSCRTSSTSDPSHIRCNSLLMPSRTSCS